MINKIILLGFMFFLFSYSVNSQTIQLTDPAMTPAQLVQNVLLGAGINAFNITFNGSPVNANNPQSSVRRFNNGGSNFPIQSGVLLQTNNAPNVNNDPDLTAINSSPFPVTNGVVIEFDFVPAGNNLAFNYIFASSEYQFYTCSQFNDVFGFFISGPGIAGPYSNGAINLATIPGSNTPVGINTVNSGVATGGSPSTCAAANPNWLSDSQYFTMAYNGAYGNLGYNGGTVILPANINLSCSDTFHIKMAISNVSDQGLDSGVFLEADSFSSDAVDIGIQASTNTSDTLLIEGCTQGIVYFTRPQSQMGDTLIIYFETGGTSDYGVDYPILAPGDSIIMLPGVDSIGLIITPTQDNVHEGPESIIITAYTVNDCGDTIRSEGIIWVDDEPYNTVTSLDTTIFCFSDSIPLWVTTEGPFAPFTYSWTSTLLDSNTIYDGDTIVGIGPENGVFEYIVVSTDACGFQYYDTSIVVVNQKLAIDSLLQFPADCGENNGAVVGYGNSANYIGTPHFTWTGPGNDSLSPSVNATAWPNRSPGWYYFTIKDDVCEVLDSILVEQNPPPKVSFEATPTFGMTPFDVHFVNTSDPASTYIWDFGNGNDTLVHNLGDQHQTYTTDGVFVVTLVGIEGSCVDIDTALITVVYPVSYDMTNVFTPNGDGSNDLFTINAENAASLEIIILNRWGNVVFESSDINFLWNGKVQNNGANCSEGTYFYKFTIVDLVGNEKKEHGFVHLLR